MPVLNTIAYYERLIASQMPEGRHDDEVRKEALRRTQEFARLFLSPGVGHCGSGAGPDTVDLISPFVPWVEQGIAPDQIIASKVVNGVTTFSRPLCPYPALPRYSGSATRRKRAASTASPTRTLTTTSHPLRYTSTTVAITRSSRSPSPATTAAADSAAGGLPVWRVLPAVGS